MKKYLIILIAGAAMFGASHAEAAISFNSSSTAIFNGFSAGKTVTSTISVSSNANRAVVMCASIWQDVGGAGTISSTTLNNVGGTKVVTSTRSGGMAVEAWRWLAPSSGSLNATATVSGNIDAVKIVWMQFDGVDQTTPVDATSTATGSTANSTTSITTATDNAYIAECISLFGTADVTVKAGQTAVYEDRTGSITGAGSYKAATTAGAYTVGYTWTGNNDWSEAAVDLRPAAAAGGSTSRRRQTMTLVCE